MTQLRIVVVLVASTLLACGDNMTPAEPDAGVTPTPGAPGEGGGEDDVGNDDSDSENGLACSLEEITPILTCAFEECLADTLPDDTDGLPELPDFDLGEVLGCAAVSCLPELLGVSPDCAGCLFGLVDGSDPDELAELCGDGLGGLPGGFP